MGRRARASSPTEVEEVERVGAYERRHIEALQAAIYHVMGISDSTESAKPIAEDELPAAAPRMASAFNLLEPMWEPVLEAEEAAAA